MNVCAGCRRNVESPRWRWMQAWAVEQGAKLPLSPYRASGSQLGWSKGQATWRDPGVSITWPEVQAWLEADETRTCSLTIARELADLEKTWRRT